MIEEMLNANELEKMLSDSFANYVVQTALDYADPETKTKLVDAIRPILPAIRQTPYGRRIQSKIIGNEGQGRGRLSGGPATPNDVSSGQIPIAKSIHPVASATQYGTSTINGYQGLNNAYITAVPTAYQTNGNVTHVGPYAPSNSSSSTAHSQTFSNGSSNYTHFSSDDSQPSVQQPAPSYSRAPQVNGFNYF